MRIRGNLHLRLYPWPGMCQDKEELAATPSPAPIGNPAAGQALYGYVGDMRVRFVFDAPGTSASLATVDDLAQLGLAPERALVQALVNLRRVFGAPRVVQLEAGVYSFACDIPDLAPSYLLDRGFWNEQFAKFPQGLLAAVPRRGMLLFTPMGSPAAEAALLAQASHAATQAGEQRLSAYVYRFGADGWQVHGPLKLLEETAPAATGTAAEAVATTTRTAAAAGSAAVGGDSRYAAPGADIADVIDVTGSAAGQDKDLHRAAAGQKMLVFAILGGIALNVAGRGILPLTAVNLLQLGLGVYCLVGVFRLARGLGKGKLGTTACMLLSCLPLANIITWIVLSMQATRALRAAGWSVGLLGAREPA